MGTWLVIESYHRFGDPHTPCLVAVCPEELHGQKGWSDIVWRIFSKETQFETRADAEAMANTTRGLQALKTPPKSQGAIALPCGCQILPTGRATTCELWRKAGGALGSQERLFPAELYQEVRQHEVDLEWQKPKIWDRMEFGVSQVSDLDVIAKKLKKHPEVKKKVLALKAPTPWPLVAPKKKKKDWTAF